MFAQFTHLNLFYFTVLKIEMWREVSSETPSLIRTRKINSKYVPKYRRAKSGTDLRVSVL
jgi:hypothetical protein